MSRVLPASVDLAILGAGPVGLEAALAAADAGYDFAVFEAASQVAAEVSRWGHVRLFSPWDLDVSPRARRWLREGERPAPSGDQCPTGTELVERVFAPLASDPRIESHLELGARVVSVGRSGLLKSVEIGSPARSTPPLRLLVDTGSSQQPVEHVVEARVVLDCTGAAHRPAWLGDGGIPAPGERALCQKLVRRIPDFEKEAAAWAGRSILLVGSGHSAQTAAVELMRLAEGAPSTRVHWVLRRRQPSIERVPDDPLALRDELHLAAQRILDGACPSFEVHAGTLIDELEPGGGHRIRAHLRHREQSRLDEDALESVEVDRVLGLVGSLGDHELYAELQIHRCYATDGPMTLAAQLLGEDSADCLAQESSGVEVLRNPEPDFFILGSKSYGRQSTFLMRLGWQQVDEVFELLAAEETLPSRPRRSRATG